MAPPVGYYNVSSIWSKKTRNLEIPYLAKPFDQINIPIGFNSRVNRFSQHETNLIGPGTYEPDNINFNSADKPAISREPRFISNNELSSPGPGSYNEYDSWNKQSFNALYPI